MFVRPDTLSQTHGLRNFSGSCGQFAFGGFPFGRGLRETFLNVREFAVDFLRATGLFVSLRLFQFGGEFDLLRFEFLDFLFQLVNQLLLRLFFAGTRLTLLRFETFLFLAVNFHRRRRLLCE